MTDAPIETPVVPILLLGDADVGKSAFLSRLTLGNQGHSSKGTLPTLRDLDQPFPFNIRMYNRNYRFEFYDTASPENYTLLQPAVVILCYSISNPQSLKSVHTYWKPIVETHFNGNDSLPVILLGLKRDVRSEEDYGGSVKPTASDAGPEDHRPLNGRSFVYPQEALKVAQQMRCDRYCECSAMTGELCREVFEDIAKTAGMTTTSRGGRSEEPSCSVM